MKFNFRNIWNAFMAVVYIVLAYVIAFTTYLIPYSFHDSFSTKDEYLIIRVFLAVSFSLYGLYRGYVLLKSLK
ncbi:hypothetical protein M2132_000318 [Dysgonomonas sp. PH5-45]|nr:hypothetical protein [Dysgonomonas sp. PH5-45]MDH6386900.1 hypothetical protein [Dysgonomonas sp. PH5-37]